MTTDTQPTEEAREARARRALSRQGNVLHKSRVRPWPGDDFGGYMIADQAMNCVVAGSRFELTLEDVEEWASAD
jgi:hypothetical protein